MNQDRTHYLVSGSHQVVTYKGVSFPVKFLRDSIPDVPTALFFAKLYELSPAQLASLLDEVVASDVSKELFARAADHSQMLQDYIVDRYWDGDGWAYDIDSPEEGEVGSVQTVHAEILPEVWKNLEIEVASSIRKVADTIATTIAKMPSRSGEMVFQTMALVNARRPVIGDYKATIKHQQLQRVLVVFDVSGSMTEPTVRAIVDDVVGLAYEANASLAIVSNSCTFWEPGSFDTDVVVAAAEFGGTHYEELLPLFDGQPAWDVVITIADYDSSPSAKRVLSLCDGRIGELLDISLVDRSTFLAECLGQFADSVRPLLISSHDLR